MLFQLMRHPVLALLSSRLPRITLPRCLVRTKPKMLLRHLTRHPRSLLDRYAPARVWL